MANMEEIGLFHKPGIILSLEECTGRKSKYRGGN